MQLLRL
ncbi:unnamed protein product [Amaranthus hypochondriacus]